MTLRFQLCEALLRKKCINKVMLKQLENSFHHCKCLLRLAYGPFITPLKSTRQ